MSLPSFDSGTCRYLQASLVVASALKAPSRCLPGFHIPVITAPVCTISFSCQVLLLSKPFSALSPPLVGSRLDLFPPPRFFILVVIFFHRLSLSRGSVPLMQ